MSLNRREQIKQFLMDNPGWHDAYEIAEALNTSPRNVQHIASLIKRNFPIEIKEGVGGGNRNQYRYQEE